MFSHSQLDDRFLTQSFYKNVFQRFCQGCDRSVQVHLKKCTFGIAPNQDNINTFFIVAPEAKIAEALAQEIDNLLQQTTKIMAGIEQIAICFIPVNAAEDSLTEPESNLSNSEFMIGQFFSLK